MGKEQYIGGSFASDDSSKYKLKNQKTPFFLQNMNSNKCVLGFETGADALAFVLINWLKNNNKSSIFKGSKLIIFSYTSYAFCTSFISLGLPKILLPSIIAVT